MSPVEKDTSAESGGGGSKDATFEVAIGKPNKLDGESLSEGSALPLKSKGNAGSQRGRVDVTRTKQQKPIVHEIWESQLVQLLGLRRDGYSDLLAGAVAAAVSLAPTSSESLVGYFCETPAVPISWLHMIEIVLCGASVAVGIVAYRLIKSRKNEGEELAEIIRGQSPD